MSTNQSLFERAQKVIPGGVNSPVRAFRAVGGTPRFVARAQGAYLWDAEDKKYIDYIGSWGPMILGHAHPAIVEAITAAAQNAADGTSPTSDTHAAADFRTHLAKVLTARAVAKAAGL